MYSSEKLSIQLTLLTIMYLIVALVVGTQLPNDQNEPDKTRFCAQTHFDSIFFDGNLYKFVVKKPRRMAVDIFTVMFNAKQNLFYNFTHKGGVDLNIVDLYMEFYYRDPVGHTYFGQMDYNAYEYYFCSTKKGTNTSLSKEHLFDHCDHQLMDKHRKLPNSLFSPKLATTYTSKHRIYLFEPESKLLWVLLNQNSPQYGWVKLQSVNSHYSHKWTFDSRPSDSHLYTGAFIFYGQIYLVEEKVSRYGFRYPSVVRQMSSLQEFSFTSFRMGLSQFFNCSQMDMYAFGSEPDRAMATFNSIMIIMTSIMFGLFVLSCLIAFILYRDNNRLILRLFNKHLQHRKLEIVPSEESLSKLINSSTRKSTRSLTSTNNKDTIISYSNI